VLVNLTYLILRTAQVSVNYLEEEVKTIGNNYPDIKVNRRKGVYFLEKGFYYGENL